MTEERLRQAAALEALALTVRSRGVQLDGRTDSSGLLGKSLKQLCRVLRVKAEQLHARNEGEPPPEELAEREERLRRDVERFRVALVKNKVLPEDAAPVKQLILAFMERESKYVQSLAAGKLQGEHRKILAEVTEVWKRWPEVTLAQVFLRHSAALLRLYSEHFRANVDADDAMEMLVWYAFVFSDLKGMSAERDPQSVQQALMQAQRLKNVCVETSVTNRQMQVVRQVQERLVGAPPNLVQPYRRFLEEDTLGVVDTRTGVAGQYRFYLFDDLLLCARESKVIEAFWLSECRLQEVAASSSDFEIHYKRQVFTLRSANRSRWMDTLRELIAACSQARQFGVDPAALVRNNGNPIPFFMYHCLATLSGAPASDAYLFTTPAPEAALSDARAALGKGYLVDLPPRVLARLFLEWFNELPQPLLPVATKPEYLVALAEAETPDDALEAGMALVIGMDPLQKRMLAALVDFIAKRGEPTLLGLLLAHDHWLSLQRMVEYREAIFKGAGVPKRGEMTNPFKMQQWASNNDNIRVRGELRYERQHAYCMIFQGSLQVYSDRAYTQKIRSIELANAKCVPSLLKETVFEVIVGLKVAVFEAPSAEDRSAWILALEEA